MNLINSHLLSYLVPRNLNSNWNLGFIVGFVFVFQIFSGLLMTFYYVPGDVDSFECVIRVLTEVNMGWAFRYFHAQCVSFCFFFMMLHMLKGLWYSSKHLPWSWYSGMVIFILSMAIAFLGYVLPNGQMSYWGATVIINLFYWFPDMVALVLGGFGVGFPTLQRFYILHFILPFVLLFIVIIHIYYLHRSSSTNPLSGVDSWLVSRFYPVIIFSDIKMLTMLFILLGVQLTYGVIPLFQGDCDNSIMANAMQTPMHIVPEWYLLTFYATLKLFPSKIAGLIAMGLLLESLILIVESRAASPVISCVHFHRVWTLVSIPMVPALFILGSLGRLSLNSGLIFIGVCSIIIIFIAVFKLLDCSRIRL
uniref:Cytochrome b n=3 Tax=Babesia TaxID=5864 RepID=A0A4Y1JNF0_9APIC|nr:cytochrome b [Babesia motasi]QNH82978.1 cytochrome b [Babesia motasi]QNH82980.1 cytochrome b [Babesia motasi]